MADKNASGISKQKFLNNKRILLLVLVAVFILVFYTAWQIYRVSQPMSEEEWRQALLEEIRRNSKKSLISEEERQEIISQIRSNSESTLTEEEREAIINSIREKIKK